MVLCVEVDEAETSGKHKIPKHLALSNRNRSLVLTSRHYTETVMQIQRLIKTTIQLHINQK